MEYFFLHLGPLYLYPVTCFAVTSLPELLGVKNQPVKAATIGTNMLHFPSQIIKFPVVYAVASEYPFTCRPPGTQHTFPLHPDSHLSRNATRTR
jgi:hypothetical protein